MRNTRIIILGKEITQEFSGVSHKQLLLVTPGKGTPVLKAINAALPSGGGHKLLESWEGASLQQDINKLPVPSSGTSRHVDTPAGSERLEYFCTRA